MNLRERFVAIRQRLTRRQETPKPFSRADEGLVLAVLTRYNSPITFNPTATRLELFSKALPTAHDPLLGPLTRNMAELTYRNMGQSVEDTRNEVIASYLGRIPDPQRRREIHIKALEQALGQWHTEAQQGAIDQSSYEVESNRILDELNKLKPKPNPNP
jgi:hypothetical protein